MALIRWEPARELRSARTDLDRLVTSVFDTSTFATGARPVARRFVPALDIVERESDYLISADLPGLSEQDITLEVADGVLTLAGERGDTSEEASGRFRRLERAYGSFRRALTLPEGVEPEGVTARFERGVLEIVVPKPAARKPHSVAIRAA